jgi:hypothetical protein
MLMLAEWGDLWENVEIPQYIANLIFLSHAPVRAGTE